jgi:hypothetical protein
MTDDLWEKKDAYLIGKRMINQSFCCCKCMDSF